MNQAMICGFVPRSGAGTSLSGPMTSTSSAAEREIDHGTLPCHPKGERRHFVERDAGMETDPALRGTAHEVVLDAVPGVDFELARIALKRDRDDDLTRRMRQDGARPRIKIEDLRRLVEV